jgi:hypothetical protein
MTDDEDLAMTYPVKGLGEIALRVIDLEYMEYMQEFYATIVRIEHLRRFPTIALFRIADSARPAHCQHCCNSITEQQAKAPSSRRTPYHGASLRKLCWARTTDTLIISWI